VPGYDKNSRAAPHRTIKVKVVKTTGSAITVEKTISCEVTVQMCTIATLLSTLPFALLGHASLDCAAMP